MQLGEELMNTMLRSKSNYRAVELMMQQENNKNLMEELLTIDHLQQKVKDQEGIIESLKQEIVELNSKLSVLSSEKLL